MRRASVALAATILLAGCMATTAPATPSLVPSVGRDAAREGARAATAAGSLSAERLVLSGPASRPPQPLLAPAIRPELVADHCVDRDLPAPSVTDRVFSVLDRSYALPAGYVPADLVAASAAGMAGSSASKQIRAVIVDDLAEMRAAWQAAGLEISIESAYRSYASQAATFDIWAARLGPAAALLRSARPGHSEHQLGTAIDFTSPGWSGRVGDWAAESAEGAWMAQHAWEYGFVMSYPAGLEAETCFRYEPWHYRWIGREAAAEHRDTDLSLRRFLERYLVA